MNYPRFIKITILITFIFTLLSCSPKNIPLNSTGHVVKSDTNKVFVAFESMDGTHRAEWFYFPGVGIINPEKYRVVVTLEPIGL